MQRIILSLGGLIFAAATLSAQQPAPAPAGKDTVAAITPALIARGDSIFHGLVANGTCHGCHGRQGIGVPGLTHDLTSQKPINGDGSYRSIMQIVQEGVANPQGVPMPPRGGAHLTPFDIQAVAAYVFSLSHPQR
jgi:mono/diheme cytochrome c family protein